VHAFYKRSPLFDEKERRPSSMPTRDARRDHDSPPAELEGLLQILRPKDKIVELTLRCLHGEFHNRFNDALENIPDLGV